MWTRKELKDRAKDVLRTSYWKAFLVSLLLAVITGGIPKCSSNFGGRGGNGGASMTLPGFPGGMDGAISPAIIAIIIIAVLVGFVVILAVLAFRIFLGYPLEVGVRQYFKQAAQDEVNMNHMGFSFAKGRYLAVVKGMLWRAFLNFLWYLLLIVPGIVKGYAYSMVPYILADNPGIGTKRAVELSNRITRP